MKESSGMYVKLSHKDVHDGGVYNSKKTEKKKRERGEKSKRKKAGEKDLSKCPLIENWLVLMTCHPKKNDVMES